MKPRLLVIGPTPPPPHGVAAYVRMLLDAPAIRERWEVDHLDTSDRRSLENLGRVDVTNVALGVRHVAALARRLGRYAPDVVWLPVSQNAPAYLRDALFILAAHAARARVVAHLHGAWFRSFYEGAPAPVRWVVRASSRRVARAWVLGEALRSLYDGLIPPERVRVIPNGVDDPLGGAARSSRSSGDGPTLLHLGQLSVEKGVLDLLAAVTRLRPEHPGLRLVLAGPWLSGADEASIRDAIHHGALGDVVELPGTVSGQEKAALFARADVFVLATRYAYEGQPLAMLEAMAAGLPVVATPRGTIPETLAQGGGVIVPEGDPAALAAALDRLARDPAARARLGAEGRVRWAADFTAERAMTAVTAALAELRPPEPRPVTGESRIPPAALARRNP